MAIPLTHLPLYTGSPDPYEVWQPSAVSGFILDINPAIAANRTLDTGGTTSVASISSTVGGRSDAFVNVSKSLQPFYEAAGWVGTRYTRPSMLFDGANDYLSCTSSLASALGGGNDTPFTLVWVAQHTSTAGTQASICIGRTSATNPLWDFAVAASVWATNKRGDSGSPVGLAGGTADTSKHIFDCVQSGTSVVGAVDGSTVFAGTQNTVSVTFDVMTLGATLLNSVPANYAAIRIARVLGFTGALSAPDLATVRSALTAMYL